MAKTVKQSQAGIRRAPITSKLEMVLDSIGQRLGVTFEVVSGGQDASTGYTGSTRHDVDPGNHGGAADVKAYDSQGNALDFNTPSGQKVWGQIAQLARAAGATGIGAAEGYMGTHEMHIGFQGSTRKDAAGRTIKSPSSYEGVWGSGGRASQAPAWLKTAWDAGSKNAPLADVPNANAPVPMPGRPAALASGLDSIGAGPNANELAKITVHGGNAAPDNALAPQMVRLQGSGNMAAVGPHPSSDGRHTFVVNPDGSISHPANPGEIRGLINPATEANAPTMAGPIVKSIIEQLRTEAALKASGVGVDLAATASGAGEALARGGNELLPSLEKTGSGLFAAGKSAMDLFSGFGKTGTVAEPAPSAAPPAPNAHSDGTGIGLGSWDGFDSWVNGGFSGQARAGKSGANGGAMLSSGAVPAVGLADVGHADAGLAPSVKINPDWTAWQAGQINPTAVNQLMDIHDRNDDAVMRAQAAAPRTPAPPKYITVRGGTPEPAPAPAPVPMVTLASGKVVPVGTTGSAQGGAYQFVVQPDGSVLNKTTGKTTAPPKAAPAAPANNNNPGDKFLSAQGNNTSGMTAGESANALNKAIFG